MTHGDLFSGIGGFSLAASWAGWTNVFQCEKDEWCRKVLAKNFPNVNRYSDIKEFNAKEYEGKIDVISGGFPCQPFSVAGKQLSEEDDRYLWPEMLRVVKQVKPPFVVCENVPGIIKLALDTALSDLENEGYTTETFIIPACAKNAWHRRDRVWVIAYANGDREMVQRRYGDCDNKKRNSTKEVQERENLLAWSDGADYERINTNTSKQGFQNRRGSPMANSEKKKQKLERFRGSTEQLQTFINSSGAGCEEQCKSVNVSPEISGSWFDSWWDVEPRMGRVVNGLPLKSYIDKNENKMDRNLMIKKAVDSGRLIIDAESGRIYSTVQRGKNREKILLPGTDLNGYTAHNIYFDGTKKLCRAHQIVWIASNGMYDTGKLMIDHINRNKKDNRIQNLRLVNASENMQNRTPVEGKLNSKEKKLMYALYEQGHMSMRELAEDFNISKSRVHQIISKLSKVTDNRISRVKGLGNAIVPQIAYEIFKAINTIYDEEHKR